MLNEFLISSCDGKVEAFKIPAFGNYLRSNGYPMVTDRLIRRNSDLAEKIKQLKSASKISDQYIIATFKTIDAKQFIEKNQTKQAMKSSLTKLNSYYYSIYESANRINERAEKAIEHDNRISVQWEELKKKSELDCIKIKELQEELKELKRREKKYKSIIDTYVYPEIANELLVKDGLLKKSLDTIKEDSLTSEIVSSTTTIKSNSSVIMGMFDGLEG